jgi:hypothetical protein
MKRRELFRRSLVTVLGAAVVGPSAGAMSATAPREFPPDYDASEELARPDWRPRFLNEHQNETLAAFGDLVIPATETPGAADALAHRFIDHLLAAETSEVQRAFLRSLAYLDGEARTRFGQAFLFLSRGDRSAFLTFLSYPHRLVTWGDNRPDFEGYNHFRHLKQWVVRAYYSSEAGMRELGWDESHMHGDFPGCPHPVGEHP